MDLRGYDDCFARIYSCKVEDRDFLGHALNYGDEVSEQKSRTRFDALRVCYISWLFAKGIRTVGLPRSMTGLDNY